MTRFVKEHFRAGPSTSTRRRRPCHDGHVTAECTVKLRWSNSISDVHRSGRSAPIWALSPRRQSTQVGQSIVGNMSCASMHASPCELSSHVLARTIKIWTVAISHVQWARQFKLSRSCQCMPLYLGCAYDQGAPSARQRLHVASQLLS